MINTFRKYGEMSVLHKDGKSITLNFKFIPAIDEVGICIEDFSVNASFGFWVETSASLEEKTELIQDEFDWLAEGEAERVAKELAEWVR